MLTSKGSKSEEMMEYLNEEFDRIEKEMELITKAIEAEQQQDISNEENSNEMDQGASHAETKEPIHLEDPERIKNKGRPKKPTRLKDIVEEIRQKMAETEAKKKKKAQNQAESEAKKKKKAQNTSKTYRFKLIWLQEIEKQIMELY